MNKKFLSKLSKLKDYEIKCLDHHFQVANMVRETMTRYGIEEKVMAIKIEVPLKRLKDVLKGAYPIDLRLLSRLQTFQQELAYDAAKLKVEAESIQFESYKYNSPVLVSRIEELLKKLETKE